VALEILRETGPLAVSSANMSGSSAATTADDAQKQLGSAIEVYLDGGPTEGPMASTIIDLTGDVPRLLRAGVIPIDKIREVTGVIEDPPEPEPEPEPEPPAAGAEALAETAEAPAETAEAPAETAEAPAETAEAPAETAEAPAETAEAPAETAGEAGQPAAREQ
jgi:hypothetical protein